ncbi:hypothetical protein FGO68_gene476 [Halteria grandinella]|uniref:Uncharacterized protein n=1 Tax=Halteria grandinella TaxID=5974 RepID=A0A8J8SWP9_HALGN|nr:hypothetical protein FGO68_gene476 [Halteria grandinella]
MNTSGYLAKSQQKIDKLFKIPLIVSTCLLAMAHGSNEVNVSAPSAAMIFLLNDKQDIGDSEAYAGMAIGLASLILGVLTLGKRYLHKYRKKFMKTTLANGMIANTSASLILLGCSLLGYPCSCTYLIIPNIFMLSRMHENRPILNDKKKIGKIILFFFAIIVMSGTLSITLFSFFSWLRNDDPIIPTILGEDLSYQ